MARKAVSYEVGSPYLIRWRDSHSPALENGWRAISDIDKDDYIVETLGFFVFETDLFVCVAGSKQEGDDLSDESNVVGESIKIAKVCIIGAKRLR